MALYDMMLSRISKDAVKSDLVHLNLPYLDDVVAGGRDVCIVGRPGYAVDGYGGECVDKLSILGIPDVGSGITTSTRGNIFPVVRPGSSEIFKVVLTANGEKGLSCVGCPGVNRTCQATRDNAGVVRGPGYCTNSVSLFIVD